MHLHRYDCLQALGVDCGGACGQSRTIRFVKGAAYEKGFVDSCLYP